MKLAKIKNKYMYKTDENDNGTHYYLIYYDRKSKSYYTAQLTYLYIKDEKRFIQVRKGNIQVIKLKEFEVPSGVRKDIYRTNINGGKINLKDKNNVRFVSKRYLSKKQSNSVQKYLGK